MTFNLWNFSKQTGYARVLKKYSNK
jgi:hypothetical protein